MYPFGLYASDVYFGPCMYIQDVDVSVVDDTMYAIVNAFQCYTISVDVYFPYYCTLWMACFTFLLILCYCCCAHGNDVSHTLHRERALYLVSELQVPKLVDWGT